MLTKFFVLALKMAHIKCSYLTGVLSTEDNTSIVVLTVVLKKNHGTRQMPDCPKPGRCSHGNAIY